MLRCLYLLCLALRQGLALNSELTTQIVSMASELAEPASVSVLMPDLQVYAAMFAGFSIGDRYSNIDSNACTAKALTC